MNYNEIVKRLTPKEKRMENAVKAFIAGGVMGAASEILVSTFGIDTMYIFWIVLASLLTGMGIADTIVDFLRMGVIIPITGFAHSMTASALEYREEGLITGIGANFMKLAGSVILYGMISAFILVLLRRLLWLL